jgi:hypothetical protein
MIVLICYFLRTCCVHVVSNHDLIKIVETHPQGTAITFLVEPVDCLEDIKELDDTLPVPEAGVLLEVELDELAERLGLVGVDDVAGKELVEPHLLLQILKV